MKSYPQVKNVKNIAWDESNQCHIYRRIYDFKEAVERISQHLDSGGDFTSRVLAGIMGISTATFLNWMNPKHNHFKPDLKQIIDIYKNRAAFRTSQMHLEMARGDLKGDSRSMNARYDRQCFGLTTKFKAEDSHSDKVEIIMNDYVNGDISKEEAAAWLKSIDNIDLKKALSEVEELLKLKS